MPQSFINRLKAFNDTLEAAASQGNQPRINNEFIRLDYEADRLFETCFVAILLEDFNAVAKEYPYRPQRLAAEEHCERHDNGDTVDCPVSNSICLNWPNIGERGRHADDGMCCF